MTPRDALIVALDVENVEAARALVEKLGDSVVFYKIGLELAFAGGLDFADASERRRQARLSRFEAA